MKRDLPAQITSLAFRASNGEYAWHRSDIIAALKAIADIQQAILGGEVWIALQGGRWHGLVPSGKGGPPGVWHWETKIRKQNESWLDYCRRTMEESIFAVEEMRVVDEAREDVRDHLYYNVTYMDEGSA